MSITVATIKIGLTNLDPGINPDFCWDDSFQIFIRCSGSQVLLCSILDRCWCICSHRPLQWSSRLVSELMALSICIFTAQDQNECSYLTLYHSWVCCKTIHIQHWIHAKGNQRTGQDVWALRWVWMPDSLAALICSEIVKWKGQQECNAVRDFDWTTAILYLRLSGHVVGVECGLKMLDSGKTNLTDWL